MKNIPDNEIDTSDESSASPDAPDSPEAPKKERKVSTADIVKFAGLIAFFLLAALIVYFLVPIFEPLFSLDLNSSEAERTAVLDQLKEDIRGAGAAGIFVSLGLQFIQIIVAFIPGEIVQIAIGYVYHTLVGSLILIFGSLIASAFIFFLVRRLGAPFVQGMIGDKDSKVLNFLNKGRRLNTMVFILYLIPGLPKDIFTYLFPLTKIRPANFFILSTLGRTPAIVASAYFGSAAGAGEYTQAIVVGVIAGGLGLLGVIFNRQILELIDKIEDKLRRDKKKRELLETPENQEEG